MQALYRGPAPDPLGRALRRPGPNARPGPAPASTAGEILAAERATPQGLLRWRIAVRDGRPAPGRRIADADRMGRGSSRRSPGREPAAARRGDERPWRRRRNRFTEGRVRLAIGMTPPDRDALLPPSNWRAIAQAMPPTPQQRWPLLDARCGAQVGSNTRTTRRWAPSKLRGGLVYRRPEAARAAARGGQRHARQPWPVDRASPRRATARRTIVVPRGNSVEKNAAMRALGAELIEHGEDFQAAREHAAALAEPRWPAHGALVPPDLVRGVASYWMSSSVTLRGDAPRWCSCPSAWLGHLRLRGGRGDRCRPRASSAWCRRTPRPLPAVVRGGRAVEAPVTTCNWPTAWPAACRSRTRWPSSAARSTKSSA